MDIDQLGEHGLGRVRDEALDDQDPTAALTFTVNAVIDSLNRLDSSVAPPVWLPPVPVPRRVPSTAERLASDLEALGHPVEREPPPISSGAHLLFPDLVLDRSGARWFIEVLGFATHHYLAAKLDRYREAGTPRVVLCADLATAPNCQLAAQVCGFSRHVEVDDLLAAIDHRETVDPDSSAGG